MTTERAIELLNRISDEQFDGIHGDERREALSMAVRALEQNLVQESGGLVKELVNDCISRQEAIEIVRHRCKRLTTACVLAVTEIEQLPSVQPEPHWIPCSERLPEDISPVIITWKNTDPESYYQYIVGKHFTGTACYKGGKWYWYSSTTEDMLAEYGRYDSEEFDEAIECIAWMPLPEPYGGESDE